MSSIRTSCTASSMGPVGLAPSRTTPPNSLTLTGLSVLALPKLWLTWFSSKVLADSTSAGRTWRRFMATRDRPSPAAIRTGWRLATAFFAAATIASP